MNIICPSGVRLSKAAILGNFPLPLSYLTDVMKNDSLSQETKKKKKFNSGRDEKSGVKRHERRKK